MQSHCSFGYVSHMCVSLVASNLCWLIHRFIRSPSLTFPSLGFFFSHSHSQGPTFPVLLAREVGMCQFYPPTPHTCAVLWDWGCPQGTVVREKKENKKPSISLHSSDTGSPLPSSFGQRDGLFLGVLGAHFAQQQGNAMSRAGFTLGQRENKEKKYPGYFITYFGFQGPHFPVIWAERGDFFLEFFVIFSHCTFPWFDTPLDQSQELREENLIQEIYQCMFLHVSVSLSIYLILFAFQSPQKFE